MLHLPAGAAGADQLPGEQARRGSSEASARGAELPHPHRCPCPEPTSCCIKTLGHSPALCTGHNTALAFGRVSGSRHVMCLTHVFTDVYPGLHKPT